MAPITDPGKASKAGRLDLIQSGGHFETLPYRFHPIANIALATVYENGELIRQSSLEEVRQRSRAPEIQGAFAGPAWKTPSEPWPTPSVQFGGGKAVQKEEERKGKEKAKLVAVAVAVADQGARNVENKPPKWWTSLGYGAWVISAAGLGVGQSKGNPHTPPRSPPGSANHHRLVRRSEFPRGRWQKMKDQRRTSLRAQEVLAPV